MNLTKNQKLMLDLEKVVGGSINVICGSVFYNKKIDMQIMCNAANELFRINDILRLKLIKNNSTVLQQFGEFEKKNIEVIYVTDMDDAHKYAREQAHIPLDTDKALCEIRLFDGKDFCGVLYKLHHMIADAWTLSLLATQFDQIMNAQPVEAFSYKLQIEADNKYLSSERFLKDKEFYTEQFAATGEPVLFSEKSVDSLSSKRKTFTFSNKEVKLIQEFTKDNTISMAVFFLSVISVYFSRTHNNCEKFYIGLPVVNRTGPIEKNTAGLFINTAPLAIRTDNNSTFLQLTEDVGLSATSVMRHQKYNYEDILTSLNDKFGFKGNLFDVIFSYQNAQILGTDFESTWYHKGMQKESLQIHIDDRDNNGILKIHYDYQTEKFTDKNIESIHNHICNLLLDALKSPAKKLYELEILPADEKQRILLDFNGNAIPYPKDKCIHEMFEEQAEKTPDKVAVVAADKTLTYRELNEQANAIAHSLIEKGIGKDDIVGLMLPRKSCLLSALFGVLKTGAAYLPIDPEHPQERIEYMLCDSQAKYCITDENISELLSNTNTDNLNVNMSSEEICYCIYTSGSTGKPKGTLLTHRNVVNYVSSNEKNVCYGITGKDCRSILSVTTVGFDIFVTESILPLVNGMEIILANEEQAKLQSKLSELLENHPADVIQTTPTKMKSLMSNKGQLDYLKKFKVIILGGEALDSAIVKELKECTSAEIYNIYGPTETTVWVTYAKIEDSNDITIGQPMANTHIHILDKYLKAVPVGVVGELCIAGDSVAAGYLNRPELTAEKFIDNPFGEGKLYRTGDLAYWCEDGNIVFAGRKDFQVKIRGLRIELGEIESALQNVSGIDRAVVVVRKDKEDRQLICAFYTGEEKSTKEIREIISKSLPRYMLPHIFTFLAEMPMTSSGKVNRNALPEIELESISTETEYVAAETEKEKLLTECICKVLGAEKVSVLDNFFDIGGDSLKSIELTARLEEKGYTVAIKTIFSCKDIREIAENLEVKRKEEKIEYGSVIPATAAQMRVYTAQMLAPDSTLYNVTYAFKAESTDKQKLERAINKLIERHESLRTHFENREGVICQVIDEGAEISVESIEDINAFTKPFDLGKSPLIRVGCSNDTVIISMHHITVDGESMPVFFRELNELYMSRELSDAIQYGEFAVTDRYTEDNEKYWLNIFSEEAPTLEMPTDFARKATQSFNGNVHYELIDIALHERIKDKCKEQGITPYVFYMTCFNILLSKYSGNEDIVVGMPASGRQSRYLDTVGMFVNTIALRSKPEGNKRISELLSEIRDSSIQAIDNQSYPFGELIKKLNIEVGGRNPLYDVMLAYQSFEMTDITFGDKKVELIPLPSTNAKCDLTFNILPREKDVVLAVEYCTDLYTEKTVQRLTDSFNLILEKALDEKVLIRDISVTDMSVVNKFNDTAVEYAKDKCIHEMFEEQAEKTPDKVAVVAADKTLTYRELNEEANRIAHSLMEKGVGKGDIVGLMLPRKSCFLSALFGVLKTGAAYLPLDPDHPEERNESTLADSGAILCISEENFYGLLENDVAENPDSAVVPDDFCYCIYTSGSAGSPKGALLYHRNLVWYMSVLKNLYGTENINMPFFTSQSVDLTVPSIYFPLITGGTVYMYNGELKNDLVSIFDNEKLNIIKFTPTHIGIVNKLVSAKSCPNLRCVIVGGESFYKDACVEFLNKFGKHIEIHNEYGPTEATVSCTDYIVSYDENTDEAYFSIGSPVNNAQIYITDNYLKAVPVGVTGELCIAGDGVGAGYLNNPELTAEKFVDNPFGEGKLYRTGDLAYWREDGNIVFVGRKDYQVKIRGLRVELGEIEGALQAIEGTERAAVVVRKDKEDRQLICAFYTGEEKPSKQLREKLSRSLPKYMIPHIFTHLKEMPMTVSGKVNRKALPETDLENIGTETEYTVPETLEETALSDAVCSVMQLDSISMQDNFFNIGGDSIKAIYIVSELEEQGYRLHVSDVMQKETFSEMAKAMTAISEKTVYDQNEVNGFIEFSPIMSTYLKENGTVSKDFAHICIVSVDCDALIARKALDALVAHHDILRGTICENGIAVYQSQEREAYSFEQITVENIDELKEFIVEKSFDDKLIQATFCIIGKESFISIGIHHFLIDLVSWEIFIKDFLLAIEQLKKKEDISLPAKTASFKLWNDRLQKYREAISQESKTYWDNVNKKLDSAKTFSSDKVVFKESESFSFNFEEGFTDRLIKDANHTYGTKTNEMLVTALGLAAAGMVGGPVGIIVESHGRTELDRPIAVERTIGWFTACYPVVIENNSNTTDELVNVKETLRRIPGNGIDYLLLSQNVHKNAEIKFNFYQNISADKEDKSKLVAFISKDSLFRNRINVDCSVTDNVLTISVSFPKDKYYDELIQQLINGFKKQLEQLVSVCTENDTVIKTSSDYSDDELTEAELNELKDLFDWMGDDE